MKRKMQQQRRTAAADTTRRSHSIYENWLSLWWQRHKQAWFMSYEKMRKAPFATLLTVTVIAISLALPTLLLLLLRDAQAVSAGWKSSTQISIFLKMDVTEPILEQLIGQLQSDPDIAKVNYISATAGLQQFEKASGFSNLEQALPDNPLPAVLEVQPSARIETPEAVQQLVNQLKALPQADVVQLDMQWVTRLFALLDFIKRAVIGLAILLGLGIVLIIGNTIRLATENNRVEIDIMKLIGATNAFVRRPFLYTGILYGLAGGIVAWLMVEIIFWSLRGPIARLALTYQTPLTLNGLGFSGSLLLWFSAATLGLMGAWLVVSRYLNVTKAE